MYIYIYIYRYAYIHVCVCCGPRSGCKVTANFDLCRERCYLRTLFELFANVIFDFELFANVELVSCVLKFDVDIRRCWNEVEVRRC